MMPATVISHRHEYRFAVTPQHLWNKIQEFDQFEHWWPWLTDLRIEGHDLAVGTVLHGVVTPPLPYRMGIRIEVLDVQPSRAVDTAIGGDLIGEGQLRLRGENGSTCAEVAWTVEMRQPAMRLAARFARPLLQWGHDRVVESAVAGFRRQVEQP
jgi:hypothetical protein